MKTQRHALESLLIALLEANVPVLQLMGMLTMAGIKFNPEELHSPEDNMAYRYSMSKVRDLINTRINMCRVLFPKLLVEYDGFESHRLDNGLITILYGAEISAENSPEEAEEKVGRNISLETMHWPVIRKKILRIHHLERKFVEAVKTGDSDIFYEAQFSFAA